LAEDTLSLISLVIGGSGIAGWIMTYLHLREERRARIISRYRETIMTPEFLDILSVFEMTKDILRAKSNVRKGKATTVILRDRWITASSEAELDAKLEQAGAPITKALSGTLGKGVPIVKLFPKRVQNAFDLAMESIGKAWKSGDWSIADKQYEAMYSEIRKMLGFEE
jgi:hypothetical protein